MTPPPPAKREKAFTYLISKKGVIPLNPHINCQIKPVARPAGKLEPRVPTDLRKALAAGPLVKAVWRDHTPIARRDFIRWIDSAKQPETRRRRIEKACGMLAAGKRRP